MDTLVRDPYHSLLSALPGDMTARDFMRWKDRDSFEQFERGEIDEPEFFRRYYRTDTPPEWRDRLQRPEKIKKELFRNPVHFLPGMEDLLKTLHARPGVRVGVASNYSRWYHAILRKRPEIEQFAHYLFFSCEVGHRKPDRAYYEAIHAGLRRDFPDLREDSLLFLDDREVNVAGAREAGWRAVLFREAAAALPLIEQFLESDEWVVK